MLPLIFLFNYITAALFYQPLLDNYFKTECRFVNDVLQKSENLAEG